MKEAVSAPEFCTCTWTSIEFNCYTVVDGKKVILKLFQELHINVQHTVI